MVAGHPRTLGCAFHRGANLAADGSCIRATRLERAPASKQARRVAPTGEIDSTLPPAQLFRRVRGRNRRKEGTSIWMNGARIDAVGIAFLHDAAPIQHDDALREVTNHGEIMSNEQVSQPPGRLKSAEQVQNLRLDRQVESAHGLVADHQSRVRHQRSRDGDPLSLASGKLGWKPVGYIGAQTHRVEQLCNTFANLSLREVLRPHRLRQSLADSSCGVERAVRILEDGLKIGGKRSTFTVVQRRDVTILESDGPGGGSGESENRPADGGLSRPRLANQADSLTWAYREANAVNSAYWRTAMADVEVDAEIVNLKHGGDSGRSMRRQRDCPVSGEGEGAILTHRSAACRHHEGSHSFVEGAPTTAPEVNPTPAAFRESDAPHTKRPPADRAGECPTGSLERFAKGISLEAHDDLRTIARTVWHSLPCPTHPVTAHQPYQAAQSPGRGECTGSAEQVALPPARSAGPCRLLWHIGTEGGSDTLLAIARASGRYPV